jgi:adenylate kinase family enzyme
MITGRLFSIDGAGGVGKTTLAIEAAKRFKQAFRDGVLKPIRVDEHTPVSFAVHLAAQLGEGMEEPVDAESAQRLVTRLLQDRQCLVILDNAPGPVPFDFLRQLAKHEEISERLEQLYTFSWCERRESDGERAYELHQLVRELVRGRFEDRYQENFIQLVHDIFIDESVHFTVKEKYYLQLEEAFTAASGNEDQRLKEWLYDLFDFCTFRGFADFYIRLTQRVETLFPKAISQKSRMIPISSSTKSGFSNFRKWSLICLESVDMGTIFKEYKRYMLFPRLRLYLFYFS